MNSKVVNLDKNIVEVVSVKETYLHEQCLNEHEIGLARDLIRERVVVTYEATCFSIFSSNGCEDNSTKMCFRINLLQRGRLRRYMFEESNNERIVEISIHEKKYARVVFLHKKNSERTKLFELQEYAILREVLPGRKYLSFGNSGENEDVSNSSTNLKYVKKIV